MGLGPFRHVSRLQTDEELYGSVDYLGDVDVVPLRVLHGSIGAAKGWTISAGGKAPEAMVLFIDGQIAGATTDYYSCEDVRRAISKHIPDCGWTVSFSTLLLSPGSHQAAVYAVQNGRTIRLGKDLDFLVVP